VPKVSARYFGKLRELLSTKSEEYEVPQETTLADLLLKHIPDRHGEASRTWLEEIFRTVRGEVLTSRNGTPVLSDYMILIDGKTPKLNDKLKDGTEIAVLPPFGGG